MRFCTISSPIMTAKIIKSHNKPSSSDPAGDILASSLGLVSSIVHLKRKLNVRAEQQN